MRLCEGIFLRMREGHSRTPPAAERRALGRTRAVLRVVELTGEEWRGGSVEAPDRSVVAAAVTGGELAAMASLAAMLVFSAAHPAVRAETTRFS